MAGWPHDYGLGEDIQAYEATGAFWRALRERAIAVGAGGNWPQHNQEWERGTVQAVADVDGVTPATMTDATKDWIVPPQEFPNQPHVPRWDTWLTDDENSFMPEDYDVVLNCDDPDPTRHVQVQIITNDETTLTLQSNILTNHVTAGWIPSVAWLVGKPYVIIKRGGLWWGTRWPRQPNDSEHWRGGSGDASGRTVITIEGENWLTGNYVGKLLSLGPVGSPIIETPILEVNGNEMWVGWFDNTVAVSDEARVMDGATVVSEGTVAVIEDGMTSGSVTFRGGVPAEPEDLMVYGGTSLQRIPILRYQGRGILFARRTAGVGGAWSVVAQGDRAWPGVLPDPPYRWYGGATEPYFTHRANDLIYGEELALTGMPVSQLKWAVGALEGNTITCAEGTHEAFDIDVWSEPQEACSEADKPYSPDFFKTLRSMQIMVEFMAGSFVPPIDYTGAKAIHAYSIASLFHYAGINPIGPITATADVNGVATFQFPDTDGPYGVYVDIRRTDTEERVVNQTVGVDEGGEYAWDGGIAGKTYRLIATRGWTRRVPREFAHAYRRSAFIPDLETTEFGTAAVVPGTHKFPGTWTDRAASDRYKVSDDMGYVATGALFEYGKRARYSGDTWGDPAVEPRAKPVVGGGQDVPYYRNLWEGRFRKDVQGDYDTLKAGTVLFGGPRWFQATEALWYRTPIVSGIMATLDGHATGGSTTTLLDNTQFVEDPVTFDVEMDGRWAQAGRWVDSILEVHREIADVEDNVRTVVTRTPIVAQPGDTGVGSVPTLGFEPVPAYTIPEVPADGANPFKPAIEVPALTIADGTYYVIREPATRRNWFQGRTVLITNPDGTNISRIITHHDDKQMWFESGDTFEIAPGARFVIEELKVGSVYAWDGAKWVEPTDNPRELPLPNLLPKTDTVYGRMNKGDYVVPVMRELYLAINALVWTKEGARWDNHGELNRGTVTRSDEAAAENEAQARWDQIYSGFDTEWAAVVAAGDGSTPTYPIFEYPVNESGAPYTTAASEHHSIVTSGHWQTAVFAEASGRYSYAHVEDIPSGDGMSRSVEVYVFTAMNFANSDPSDATSGGNYESHVAAKFASGDANGYQFRRWSLTATVAASSGVVDVQTEKIGTMSHPPIEVPGNLGWSPPDPDSGSTWAESNGYAIIDQASIVKWNIPGGFKFV